MESQRLLYPPGGYQKTYITRFRSVALKNQTIFCMACEYWTVTKIENIAITAIRVHNMIVKEERTSHQEGRTAT